MTNLDYSGFRVGIIGSCQVGGIDSALRQLLPGAELKTWHFGVTAGTAEEIVESVTGYDLIVSQMLFDFGAESLRPDSLKEKCRSLVLLPIFGFPGFHPDCILVQDETSKSVDTPLGPYNSAIVFACYKLGLSESRTRNLFNSFVYNGLGYMDAYTLSKNAIVNLFQQFDYEISDLIDRWHEQLGSFMYTSNHPKGLVLWDLTVLALAKAGLQGAAPDQAFINEYLSLNAIWPVYPEIAQRFGFEGGLEFAKVGNADPASDARRVGLDDYIAESFRAYSQYDVSSLTPSNPSAVEALGLMISNSGIYR